MGAPLSVRHDMPKNLRAPEAPEYRPYARVELEPLRVTQLRDVRADALGLLSRRGRLLQLSFGRSMDAFDHRSPRRYLKFLVRTYVLSRTRRVPTAMWIVDNLSPGYFHWMTECLPRLLVGVGQDAAPKCLLLPGAFERDGFVAETLEAFPEVAVRYIGRWSVAKVGRALVPERVGPPGVYRPEILRGVADRLAGASADKSRTVKPAERIYVSRVRSGRRQLVNEDAVVNLLAERGFVTIYPEELTVADQIAYARGARYMVGAHGGGLTNMMFMSPGASVLELRRGHGQWGFECFFTLAGACGIDYYYELCHSNYSVPGGYYHHGDLVVDLDSLRKTVGGMLAAPR